MKRLTYFIASLVLPLAVLGGCNPDVTPPPPDDGPTGSIVVSLSMTGGEVDRDGCGVRIDNARCGRLRAGDDLKLPAVPVGMHTLTLHGLDANCSVAGGTLRTLSVSEGQTEFVQFSANCGPPGPENCSEVGELTGRCGNEG